jgi:KDO2-lipid IV(A) lauroyltransferase
MNRNGESVLRALKYGLYCPLASCFPLPTAYRMAQVWGRMEAQRYPGLTAAIRANAESVLQSAELPTSDLGEKFFEVMSCDGIDAYAPAIHPWRRLRRWVHVTGEDRLLPVVAERRGVLLLTFHFGGGSLIFPYLRSRGLSAHYLSIPPQRVRELDGWVQYTFSRLRLRRIERTMGKEVIFVGGSKEKIRRALGEGGMVVALLDVVPEFLGLREWAEVRFFGRPARFPTGLLSAAAQTGAVIIPFFGRVGEDLCRCLSFEEPRHIEKEGDTLFSLVGLLEEYIRRYPYEWHHWPALQGFYALGEDATAQSR